MNDPLEAGPHVLLGVPVARDDRLWLVRLAGVGFEFVPSLLQVRPEFRENRNDPHLVAGVMFGFWRRDRDAGLGPVHMAPIECESLAGSSQAAEPGQRHNQPVFGIWASLQDAPRFVQRHEVQPRWVCDGSGLQVDEGVFSDELAPLGDSEELTRTADMAPDCVFCKPSGSQPFFVKRLLLFIPGYGLFARILLRPCRLLRLIGSAKLPTQFGLQVQSEAVSVSGIDGREQPFLSEEFDQVPPDAAEDDLRCDLDVFPFAKVTIEKRSEFRCGCRFTLGNQSARRELVGERWTFANPFCHFRVRRTSHQLERQQAFDSPGDRLGITEGNLPEADRFAAAFRVDELDRSLSRFLIC